MADEIQKRGFNIISKGTDNHLMLIDLRGKNVTGKVAEKSLDDANITVNKNSVPNDPASPFITSGIRVGTPAVTTRGFKETECRQLANWLCDVLENPENPAVLSDIKTKVIEITKRFPVYS